MQNINIMVFFCMAIPLIFISTMILVGQTIRIRKMTRKALMGLLIIPVHKIADKTTY